MDRKIFSAFIVIFSFVGGTDPVFGGADETDLESGNEGAPPPVAESESGDGFAASLVEAAAGQSDIVQLPTIIIRPAPKEQDDADDS